MLWDLDPFLFPYILLKGGRGFHLNDRVVGERVVVVQTDLKCFIHIFQLYRVPIHERIAPMFAGALPSITIYRQFDVVKYSIIVPFVSTQVHGFRENGE